MVMLETGDRKRGERDRESIPFLRFILPLTSCLSDTCIFPPRRRRRKRSRLAQRNQDRILLRCLSTLSCSKENCIDPNYKHTSTTLENHYQVYDSKPRRVRLNLLLDCERGTLLSLLAFMSLALTIRTTIFAVVVLGSTTQSR
jgi:hypothetical protein